MIRRRSSGTFDTHSKEHRKRKTIAVKSQKSSSGMQFMRPNITRSVSSLVPRMMFNLYNFMISVKTCPLPSNDNMNFFFDFGREHQKA